MCRAGVDFARVQDDADAGVGVGEDADDFDPGNDSPELSLFPVGQGALDIRATLRLGA